MGKERARIVFDSWDTYVSQSEGNPFFISFDVEAAQDNLTDTLVYCARVIIPIHHPNESGGPQGQESETLYELEDELCARLKKRGVICRLVARLTWGATRELVFQLEDWDSFRPLVGLWMMDHKDYEIDVSEHEGWSFFDDCIRPTPEVWLYLADQSVVRTLVEAGSDPAKEHELEFVFNGDERGLRQAVLALKKRGYLPDPKTDIGSGQIVMVIKMVLDTDAIFAESQAHTALAEKHGIEYDGWGALVVS